MKNIIITAVKNYDDRDVCEYYYDINADEVKFIDEVVIGEAGTKYILANNDIDEIIMVGTDIQISEENIGKKVNLSEGIDLYNSNVDKLSDFDYFRYRLVQFVEGVDMETADFYDSVPSERRAQINSCLSEVFGDDRSEMVLKSLKEPELWKDFNDRIGRLNPVEENYVQKYMFAACNKSYLFESEKNNGNIPISFLPILKTSSGSSLMTSFDLLVEALQDDTDEGVNLFLNVSGFGDVDSYIFLSMISMLNDDPHSNIRIRDVLSANDIPSGFCKRILKLRKRLNVERLLSGINAFINDGRMGIIRDYWRDSQIKSEYVDQLLYAMSEVETGLLMCNTQFLIQGIENVTKLVESEYEHDENVSSEEESFVLSLRGAIMSDYEQMIDKTTGRVDPFEVIKWAWNKGFYQQTITLIESQIPSHIFDKGMLIFAKNEEDKQKVIKVLNANYWDLDKKSKWQIDDIKHFFVKYYVNSYAFAECPKGVSRDEFKADTFVSMVFDEKPVANLLKVYSLIEDKEILKNVFRTYLQLGSVRNMVNHGEANASFISEDEIIDYSKENPLLEYIKSIIKEFIESYQKAVDAIGDKLPDGIEIPQSELREYYKNHGPKEDKNCFYVDGYYSSVRSGKSYDDKKSFGDKPKKSFGDNHSSEKEVDVKVTQNDGEVNISFRWKD